MVSCVEVSQPAVLSLTRQSHFPQSMKAKTDHQDKKNYDDFNEFFWSRNCLRFRFSSEDPSEKADAEGLTGPMPDEQLPPVAEGLLASPKTFLEKRSWLRGVLALSRIIEWHIVTFYLLGVTAFSHELVWGWVYSLQVASAVFWLLNALHLLWAVLEVWGSYPGIHLTSTDICGSVFILLARFLTLVYQTLYLMWAFSPQKGVYLGIEADSTFWWWQYIWLSLLIMVPYAFEMLLQLFPPLTARIYMSQNDYVQSFLNILYPLSRLYTGKEVQESVRHAAVYIFFWVTLMTWKLFFSYIFEVYSMVLPSLQLTDDYMNYPDQSFMKMMLLLGMRWLPQFIVYIIDMSIWYAVWQAFAGTTVGFSDHLGDIRSMDDIRSNFGRAPEHFCKKMLSSDAGSRRGSSASFLGSSGNNLSEKASLLGSDARKLQSYVNRLLDVRIQKWVMFSAAWNEIIDHFRVEDIISTGEMDNLKFSQFDGFSQAIYLPVFQTAGVIENVLSELERPADEYKNPKTGAYSDESLFAPITEEITMQTAVAELWELGSFFFQQVLGPVHTSDIQAIVETVNKWIGDGDISTHMKVEAIRSVMKNMVGAILAIQKGIHSRKPAAKPRSSAKKKKKAGEAPSTLAGSRMRKVVSVGSLSSLDTEVKTREKRVQNEAAYASAVSEATAIIDSLRDQVRDKLRNVLHSLKGLLKDSESSVDTRDMLDRLTFMASMENGFFWNDAYASDLLDDIAKNHTFKSVLKKLHGLVCLHPDEVEPRSKEVRRRLTFFVNSLFMDIPDAPSIHDMFSWNVLTPYYSEDVTYSKADLQKRSDALGVSTLLYLQTLYKNDWNNFIERLGIKDEEKVWSKKYIDETRRWASIRAQTLSRTVNGMMYCEKALRLLANLERLDDDTTNDLMNEKFGYIVSCQVYGNMKRDQDPKADDIEALMHRFPHLRVAYIDNIRVNRSGVSINYSVLVKSNGKGGIQEVYRVRLPGNPIIGEGKPENQNHAMIFTRGEFVQTIDMNQEGYFEEALKMRNVLQEFAKREGPLPTTILGLREHIFTGSVSSLANYMAMQEISFVTLGQRVLTRPLHIRLHYGHPDVFDKLFFITRGGVSKASKGINLSEDIFAGYSNVNRGGTVGFKEYVQVGKGRDVGMSQIYKFEAKLSQGAAEQSLSRDVYRMCNRLDFFRLLSFYYGGIGHYFSNVLTILTVYIVVYLMAVLAVFKLEKIGDRMITPMGTIQMLLGGLGLLQTIPLFATLGVERGWWASLQEIILIFVTGGPLHFMFHIQTKATYMAQTILVGGAIYRPTGRGFVTQHAPFDEQWRFFAASHLYLGAELAAGLTLMGIYTDAGQYFGRTWSLWLASGSFLCSPFWFNPLTFDWNTVISDYDLWMRWMRGSTGGTAKSWSMWWNEENAFYRGMPATSKALYVVKAVLYLLVAEGIRRSSLFKADTTLTQPFIRVGDLVIFVVFLFLVSRLVSAKEHMMPYPVRRTVGILVFSGMICGILILFIEDSNYIRYAIAGYYAMAAVCLVGLLFGVKAVKFFYMIHDIVCAHLIFVPLFGLAALQLPGMIQTWLLYHNALSTDVVVSDILRYARRSQESGAGVESNEDLAEQIADLRKVVTRQDQILSNAGLAGIESMSSPSNRGAPSMPTTPSPEPIIRPPADPFARAVSMSGIDVWGQMAIGDTGHADDPRHNAADPISTSNPVYSAHTQGGFSFTQPDTMPPRN
jgi:callose synthase